MNAIEGESRLLRETFVEIFRPANPRSFGSTALGHQGLCDGNEGVQWNTWVDDKPTGPLVACLGVNLEGMKYDGWPIARLIERELLNPKLIALRSDLRQPEEIMVRWWRDAWQGAGRVPNFKEQYIKPTPIALSDLSHQSWRQALTEAQGCLSTPKGGRAKQLITLKDQRRVSKEVTPHLGFQRQLPWPATAEKLRLAMQRAREQLQPLYDFVTEQSAGL